MAFLDGIFNRPAQQQQQPQQQASQQQHGPQNQQQQQQQQQNGNGSGGPATQQQKPANEQSNPLDSFLPLLTPSQQTQQMLQQQQQQMSQPLFAGLTPEKLQEQVSKTNFASKIDPQLAQKALGGDPQAFMDVLNQVAQQSFLASAQFGHTLVEKGVSTGMDRFNSGLDSRFRQLQIRSKNSENPALQHPIGQAMLGTVKNQIAQAQPNLSAEEVHSKAEEMFSEFAKLMVQPSQQQQQQQEAKPQQQNWLSFLEDGQASQ